MQRIFWRVVMVLTLLALLPVGAWAQEATLSGTVTDSTGGVLPGVTDHRDAHGDRQYLRGASRTRRVAIAFRFASACSRWTPSFQGSARSHVKSICWSVRPWCSIFRWRRRPCRNRSRSPAKRRSSTRRPRRLGTNVDPRQMQELPVNGRNWMDLTLLRPAAARTPSPRRRSARRAPTSRSSSTSTASRSPTRWRSASGSRVSAATRSVSSSSCRIASTPRRDARAASRSMRSRSRAPTRQAAPSPGYFRDAKFNAKDPVAGVVLPYQNQQISTTFGGPIVKDRIHYFVNYEFEREPQTYVYNTPVPEVQRHADWRAASGHGDGTLRLPVLARDAPVDTRQPVRQPHPVRLALYGRLRPHAGVSDWHQPPIRTGVRATSRRCSARAW